MYYLKGSVFILEERNIKNQRGFMNLANLPFVKPNFYWTKLGDDIYGENVLMLDYTLVSRAK